MAVRLLIFIIYTIIYFFLALLSTGGGHGNFIFFLAPLVTWIFPFAAICLSSKLNNKTIRIVFVLLLLIHYFAVGMNIYVYLQSEYWQKDQRIWENYFFWQILLMAIYFVGQVYIWSFLFRKNNLVKTQENTFLNLSE